MEPGYKRTSKDPRNASVEWKKFSDVEVPGLDQYDFPDKGVDSLKSSVIYHSTIPNDTPNHEFAVDYCSSLVALAKMLLIAKGDQVFPTDMGEAVRTLNGSAGAGYPWKFLSGVKCQRDAISLYGEELIGLAEARDFVRRQLSSDERRFIGERGLFAVQLGLVDPIRVFIKNEPTKISKILEGRTRIITGMSLVDQLVVRKYLMPLSSMIVDMHEILPFKMGSSSQDESHESLVWYFKSLGLNCSSDNSSFDNRVSDMECQAAALAMDAVMDSGDLLFAERQLRSCPLLVVKDGTAYETLKRGGVWSGHNWTLGGNCVIRCAQSMALTGSVAATLGDDAMNKWHLTESELADSFAAVGGKLSDVEFSDMSNFEFGGRRIYADGTFTMSYFPKHAFRVATMLPSIIPDALECYRNEYRYSPERFKVLADVAQARVGPVRPL